MMTLFLTLLDAKEEKSKFDKLYEKYRKLMHYVAKGILTDDQLAEDAVQELSLIHISEPTRPY